MLKLSNGHFCCPSVLERAFEESPRVRHVLVAATPSPNLSTPFRARATALPEGACALA